MRNLYLDHWDEHNQESSSNQERINKLRKLIENSINFSIEIEQFAPKISLFDEDCVARQCLARNYPNSQAKAWIFLKSYNQTVSLANAIVILLDVSCFQQAWQLWRSLLEERVTCAFIDELSRDNNSVACDYIAHNLLVARIRRAKQINKICEKKGLEHEFGTKNIQSVEADLKKRSNNPYGNYAWAEEISSISSLPEILEEMDPYMRVYYEIACKETHPFLGGQFAVTGFGKPLREMPLIPSSIRQMSIDHLTASELVKATKLSNRFLEIEGKLGNQFKELELQGLEVIEYLGRAHSFSV